MFRSQWILALPAILFTGCAAHVEWAPDSKSFLYSNKDGRVLRYDVAEGTSTVVTRVTPGTEDGWPVFSQRPKDGLLVLGESRALGGNTREVETRIRYVKADGGDLRTHTLTWLALEGDTKDASPIPTFVRWSPTGQHVLVTTKDAVAMHDFEKGTFTVHEDVAPCMPILFGASPWRPDGAGFLAMHSAKSDSESLLFVTTDGESHEFEHDKFQEVEGEDDALPIGEWRGKTLVSKRGLHEYRIDTDAMKIVDTKLEKLPEYVWAVGRSRIEFVSGKGKKTTFYWTDGSERVEITKDIGPAITIPTGPIVPAPDGKTAVVVSKKGLIVVGEKGILDRVSVVDGGGDGNQ